MSQVSLVIPGRNAGRTLAACLESATVLLRRGELAEILFVDDGSTDDSAAIAGRHPVRVVESGGGGPGWARNVGWRAAAGELVWFIDADCEVRDDSLVRLLAHLESPDVTGVGGSYANPYPDRLLPSLIHEEIRQRHLDAPSDVDYLGSFNVLYRRSALEEVGGFDETYVNGPGRPGGEDADLSYRLRDLGHRLRLEPASQVVHHHPTSLDAYLRAQRLHGFWGVRLYRRHTARGAGNSYSTPGDHLQPPLAVLVALSAVGLLHPRGRGPFAALTVLLLSSTVPMAQRLVRRTGDFRLWSFTPFAALRAFARAAGMLRGLAEVVFPGLRPPQR